MYQNSMDRPKISSPIRHESTRFEGHSKILLELQLHRRHITINLTNLLAFSNEGYS